MKYRQIQLNPIALYNDPQATNIGLSYLYPENPEQASFVQQVRQEFNLYIANTIRGYLPAVAQMTGVSEEEFLAEMKAHAGAHFTIQDASFDPGATVHDFIANLFPEYGIDRDQGVFTLHRRFDPLSEEDAKFHRFIQKLKLKRPMTEEERFPAVCRSFDALKDYIETTRTGGIHSMDQRDIVFVGVPSTVNFPMHERVYRKVGAFYQQEGSFEMDVLPANPQGKESPPLLRARYKKESSPASEH